MVCFLEKHTKAEQKTHPRSNSASGFGPEIQFPHLSLAFSLILSGVPQNEVSFGKKQPKSEKKAQTYIYSFFPNETSFWGTPLRIKEKASDRWENWISGPNPAAEFVCVCLFFSGLP